MDRSEFIEILNGGPENLGNHLTYLVKEYCNDNNKDYNKAMQLLQLAGQSMMFGAQLYSQLINCLVKYYIDKYIVYSLSLNNKVLSYY